MDRHGLRGFPGRAGCCCPVREGSDGGGPGGGLFAQPGGLPAGPAAAGGVPVVAGLLQRSRHASARVMEGACQAMSFLCLMGRAIRSDGAAAVVAAMRQHGPQSAALAGIVLRNLSAWAAHRWNLVALGAPGALHEALRQHGARHQGATLRALGALGLLPDCRAAFGTAGT
ncbi:hypothetical protein PAPYR_11907 [Paratrimastix pyriformis]|uniref:Uncharacterized protein n=1 Tax=Paratrimastix pyriformis TaxID=342808 RepID=A0ABQ8U6V8_9EUKA|nr:hypothetical protein PAPYR_11907 [Paratrimastix pyriformis]